MKNTKSRYLQAVRWVGWILWPLVGLSVSLAGSWRQWAAIQEGYGEGRGLAIYYLFPIWGISALVGVGVGLIVAAILFRVLRPKNTPSP
jgi:multisubunit Na+/H+ antiporter MnhB subunit